MAALRHLADDVRERFARLRTRHTDDSTKAKRRTKVTSTDGAIGNGADRIETPDLIRPHVDVTSRTASLPPLPPTPPSSVAERSRRRRRTSAYLCPLSSAIVMGHIYEEIPSTTPPPQRHRCSSPTSGVEVGRVFYVSPLDGALCRIFPVDDRALHGRQLACSHVQRRPSNDVGHPSSSSPIDVVGIASSDGLAAVRGRELRLCVACYRQLRSSLAADENSARDCREHLQGTAAPTSVSSSSSFYNSCDLSLLNVPSCYSPEAGYVDSDDAEASKTDAQRDTHTKPTPPRPRDSGPRDSLSGDVTAKFGEPGSAFTKFDGGQRAGVDDGPSGRPAYNDNVCCDGSRPRRVVTDPSFDVRRRPLRDADDALLAVLDSTPDSGLRSDRREDVDDLRRRRISCAKSTSCADVRWARRRSLAIRRRSDDDDDGRRTRVAPATSSREATSGRRRASACCGGSESSLHAHPTVKSVYYNGLLASMIDLTAAFDRASTDDRLSCRATSGPRRSLRSTRQSPASPGLRHSDQFTVATVHHSSGDLSLRSVQ